MYQEGVTRTLEGMRAITGAALATAGLVLGSTAGAVAADDICAYKDWWQRVETREDGARRISTVTIEKCVSTRFAKRRTVMVGVWKHPSEGQGTTGPNGTVDPGATQPAPPPPLGG